MVPTFGDWLAIASLLGALLVTVVGSIGSLAWWLASQFSQTRKLVYDSSAVLFDRFTEKLEYHEQHDDERFKEIKNDLWMIRIRNAAREGLPVECQENKKNK